METEEIRQVRQSLARCTLSDDFLVAFYDILIKSSHEIESHFAHTDMPRQRQLLKASLIHLVSYSTGNEFSRERIEELSISHDRNHWNIRPELYENWTDSLIKAVRQYDAECTPELEAAWRTVVAPGIEAMTGRY